MNHEILPRGSVLQLKLYSTGLVRREGMFVAEGSWYIYIYIYVCVCVCVCVRTSGFILISQNHILTLILNVLGNMNEVLVLSFYLDPF
jgi:hypothetical protein